MDTSLIVLGSGQDGGSPQFGSTPTMPDRTASSVALRLVDGAVDEWILIDASPDLRVQWARAVAANRLPARLPRAVAVTHAHMGHYSGLVQFGTEAAAAVGVDLIAPRSVIRHLAGNEPWSALLRDRRLTPRATESGTYRFGDIELVGIPVPHRDEYSATVGFSVRMHGRPWVLYLPDIDSWDAWPGAEATIQEHDIVLLDATFGSGHELPHRSLASVPHPVVTDTITRFGHLTACTTIVLTHLNHTNPLGSEGTALRMSAMDAGFLVAEDGMVFDR